MTAFDVDQTHHPAKYITVNHIVVLGNTVQYCIVLGLTTSRPRFMSAANKVYLTKTGFFPFLGTPDVQKIICM